MSNGGVNVIDRHLFNTIPATDFRRKCRIDFSIDSEDKATALAFLASYTAYPEMPNVDLRFSHLYSSLFAIMKTCQLLCCIF